MKVQPYRKAWKKALQWGYTPYPANGKDPIVKWQKEFPNPTEADFEGWASKHADKNLWAKIGPNRLILGPDSPAAEEFVQGLSLPKGPAAQLDSARSGMSSEGRVLN